MGEFSIQFRTKWYQIILSAYYGQSLPFWEGSGEGEWGKAELPSVAESLHPTLSNRKISSICMSPPHEIKVFT